jgi:ubiquinone/menaquinone biosynthesis C-methylase UbiE
MFLKRSLILLMILEPALLAQNPVQHKTKAELEKMHQDSKAYISTLENPQRDADQKPDEVIKALGIKDGETIADIGAGSGYFAFRFSPRVGERGRVYAVDINKDMILHMNRRIRDLKLKNVVTVLSVPDDPLLMDKSIDRFFICNTWHHVENKSQYLALMKKMLRPGGQLIIIDYKKKECPAGLPPEMKLARKDVVQAVEAGGFKLAQEFRFLPYQYFLVFTPR